MRRRPPSAILPETLLPFTTLFRSSVGVSFLDRTPRAYGFQLFAVTLMLVAVAGVDHPETMFDTVVARVTEISLGVLATTFVDSVIAPRSLGGLIRSNLRRWLPEIGKSTRLNSSH